jgi:hypothetical protein
MGNVLATEFSRREFVTLVVSSALVIVGISGMMERLKRVSHPLSSNKKSSADGYGDTTYGG